MEKLKILLYSSSTADAQTVFHELTTGLAQTMGQTTDVRLVNSPQEIDDETLVKFDILHVFGCWEMSSARLIIKAHNLHTPTVYSPLGGLQPWVLKRHRSTYLYRLQKRAIQCASAVHLCSNLERETFQRLGWNTRFKLIKNPVLSSLISFEEFGQRLLVFYQKVLDTHARLLLSQESCVAIGNLLELGVDVDVLHDRDHRTKMHDDLSKLSPTDWRRIKIYSNDERIEVTLEKGLERIKFIAPKVVVEEIDRFNGVVDYSSGDLKEDELTYKSSITMDRLTNSIKLEEVNEKRLCYMLLNLKYEIDHNFAPLLHLVNVYVAFRFWEMNEDRLRELAKILHIHDFAQRLTSVLRDIMRLSEGFMPFQPLDDKSTAQLKRNITKFNIWH